MARTEKQNHIVKLKDGKFRLLSRFGKNLGTFDSHDDAAKHEGEVEYFKSKKNVIDAPPMQDDTQRYEIDKWLTDDPEGSGETKINYVESSDTVAGIVQKQKGTMPPSKEKTNAKTNPTVLYAKHMEAGLCGYEDEMILVDADAMKSMAPTFAGKPVYVGHQEVDLANLQEQADGYVADCFYNELDGWLWSKIIVVSDKAQEAVSNGWSVSNAYVPTEWADDGVHHNVDYNRKIVQGNFTHLAIVPDPRYENAKIFTPDGYKGYCNEKRVQIEELRNSKERKPMLKFWKNEKKEVAAADVDGDTVVELQNGKTITLKELDAALAAADANPIAAKVKKYEALVKKNALSLGEDSGEAAKEEEGVKEEDSHEEPGEEMLDEMDEVTHKGKVMPAHEFVNMYHSTLHANAKKNAEGAEKLKEGVVKANADEAGEKDKAEVFEKKNDLGKEAKEIKNAALKGAAPVTYTVDLDMDKLARGASRYGSGK